MRTRNMSDSLSGAESSVDIPSGKSDPRLAGMQIPNYMLAGLTQPAITMSPEIGKIAAALSKAQGKLDNAKKGTEGYGYSYSDLAAVIGAAKPVLEEFGLAVVQLPGNDGDKVNVTTILTHESGQYFQSVLSLPLVEMKVNVAQKAGATISYIRRYAFQAILGMASEDNDSASPKKKAAPKKGPAKDGAAPTKFKRNTKGDEDEF